MTAAASLAVLFAPLTCVAAGASELSIILTGQSLLQSDIRVSAPTAVQTIRPLLNGDVVFTNFETAVKERSDSLADLDPIGGVYTPPEALDVLNDIGVNLLALSNNHSFDLANAGLLNTLREVKARDITHAGIGENLEEAAAPGYIHTPHGTVALVSMASGLIRQGAFAGEAKPGINEIHLEGGTPNVDAGHPSSADTQRILASIAEAHKQANIVIAYHHNHVYDKDFVEMMGKRLPERLVPPNWIKKWTHEEVDAGADIVILHGAPLIQGVEIYRGRPIFYDLGNFIFQVPVRHAGLFEPAVYDSVVARIVFDGKNLKSVTFRPIALSNQGREGEAFLSGVPAPATGDKARTILDRLVEASRPFGTAIAVNDSTAMIQLRTPVSP
jgi:poly-gamma-glutamate synthesis protein (capsule biosynthesis protein)